MKNSQPVVLSLCSVFVFATGVLSARTLAWYRFEEMSAGDATTSATTFTNTIDETKYPAYVGVCNFGGNGRYSKNGLVYTADKMPYGTNAFPSSVALVNRQDSSRQLANNGALALNMSKIDNKNSPHAQLFIDDDESLRLQTFTLEFFVRIPDTLEGFRCFVTRPGGAYTDKRSTFYLYGQLLNGGTKNMYYMLNVTSVTDPLYDNNGIVTNQVVGLGSFSSSTRPALDNDLWHHVALVADGAAKTMSLYVDYEKIGSVSYSGDLYYEPGYPLAFGGHPQCTYFSSAFSLDEVRISDVVLAPSQMLGYEAASQAPSGVVDDSTLLYFPFEGGTETVTVGAGEMQIPVSYVPYLKNQAVNPQFSALSAVWNTRASETDDWELSSEVQGSPVRFGLRAQESQSNETAIHLMTNMPLSVKNGNDTSQTMATTLFGESCTVEFFFKMPTSGYGGTDQGTHLLGIYSAFAVQTVENSTWVYGCLQVTVGGTTLTSPASGNAANYASKAKHFNDGKWHHMAIVSDRENDRADCYIDYEWSCGADSVTFNMENYRNGYFAGLIMGGSYWGTSRPMGDFRFDEVRVSRGVLCPHQFLTTKAVESDLLGRAAFDENLIMTPYTNVFGVAGTAAKFTASGRAPTFANDVPARAFTAGKDGEVVIEKNRRSLAVDGGKVTWTGRRLLADTDEFTVEFFVKAASATAGAGLMRVNRASESDVTSDVTWALSFADSTGGLRLKVDTDAATAQTHDFAAAVADGNWHHVGIQFAGDGDDTKVSLYKDAAKVGEWTAEGRIFTNPRLMNLMIGAGEDTTAGFTGFVDELRVSPGIVAATEFLTPKKSGGILILR